ncbi:MAG TPA: hypothetical protein VF855_04300 [Acidimicrobiales bacterium]
MSANHVDVLVENGTKRCFARALDWPGWTRSGKDEAAAVEALLSYAARYGVVAERAGLKLPARPEVDVLERVTGGKSTDWGAPGELGTSDHEAFTVAGRRRSVALLQAAWTVLDETAASSAEELRKGPRGGGRDRTKMLAHVLDAEAEYARRIGVRIKMAAPDDPVGVALNRTAIVSGLHLDRSPGAWPLRYFVHRTAWHVLDHAWEMQDRQP